VYVGLGFAVSCEAAAVSIDAEFAGGSVVALDELNPVTIPILRASEDEPGSLRKDEPRLRLARNFDCKLSIFTS
jgi:hypothetical protein